MESQLRKTLLAVLPLAGVLSLALIVPAEAADRRREERRATDRVSERDLRSFDGFLDSHWETANELYRDPELIENEQFLRGHSDLREWLDDHPEAAETIQANPRNFIWRGRAGQPGRPASLTPEDLRNFDRYLDSNWEVSDALYRDPELIKYARFVRSHPSLDEWLDEHPTAAEAIQANPHKVLWRDRKMQTQDFLRQLLQ